jgi:hypothetical protein
LSPVSDGLEYLGRLIALRETFDHLDLPDVEPERELEQTATAFEQAFRTFFPPWPDAHPEGSPYRREIEAALEIAQQVELDLYHIDVHDPATRKKIAKFYAVAAERAPGAAMWLPRFLPLDAAVEILIEQRAAVLQAYGVHDSGVGTPFQKDDPARGRVESIVGASAKGLVDHYGVHSNCGPFSFSTSMQSGKQSGQIEPGSSFQRRIML